MEYCPFCGCKVKILIEESSEPDKNGMATVKRLIVKCEIDGELDVVVTRK